MKKLTKAEEAIMHYVWQLEETTTRMIYDHMSEPKTSQSTISSIIRILEDKGFINHKVIGRTYLYYPIIDKNSYSKKSIKSIAQRYFSGSISELVNFLVREEEVDIEELEKILEQNNKD